ncbi:MAG: hypothetical protein KC613_16785 [Myxococcales bacterium]|nr:hypothetical protein [Myxococcales bacterium]
MRIVDISDRRNPWPVSSVELDGATWVYRGPIVSDEHLYLWAEDDGAGWALHVVDISVPSDPVQLPSVPLGGPDVSARVEGAVRCGEQICTLVRGSNVDGMSIVMHALADPLAPERVSELSVAMPAGEFYPYGTIQSDGEGVTVAVSTHSGNGRDFLSTYALRPGGLVPLGSVQLFGSEGPLALGQSRVHTSVVSRRGRATVVDLADPRAPRVTGSAMLPPDWDDDVAIAGEPVDGLPMEQGTALVLAHNELIAISVDDTGGPRVDAPVSLGRTPDAETHSVAIAGDVAFVADGPGGLRSYSLCAAEQAIEFDRHLVGGDLRRVWAAYGVVVTYDTDRRTTSVFDATDPLALELRLQLPLGEGADEPTMGTEVAISETAIVIVAGGTLHVIDRADLSRVVGSMALDAHDLPGSPNFAWDAAIHGTVVYLRHRSLRRELWVIDISDLDRPRLNATHELPFAYAANVTVVADQLLAILDDDTLIAVDLTRPEALANGEYRVVDQGPVSSFSADSAGAPTIVYGTTEPDALYLLDVSEGEGARPPVPVPLGPESAPSLVFAGSRAVAVDQTLLFRVFELACSDP